MTVRARFDGRVFVPIDPVDVPKDQIVELDVREPGDAGAAPEGSPEALRRLMRQGAQLEPGDTAALEAAIAAGKRQIRYSGVFDDPSKGS